MKPISFTLQRCSSITPMYPPAAFLVHVRGLPPPCAGLLSLSRGGASRSYSHSRLSTRSAAVKLLHLIEDKREIQTYLARFRVGAPRRIAIIALAEQSITVGNVAAFSQSIAFLVQIGLLPIIIHGDLADSNQKLSENRPPRSTNAQNGEFISRPSVSASILNVNAQITRELEDLSTRARPITSGIFSVARDQQIEGMGYNRPFGATTDISRHTIEAALRTGSVPVLPCLGETSGGQVVRLDVHGAALQLGKALRPWRVVFLSENMKREKRTDIPKAAQIEPHADQSIINLNDESQYKRISAQNNQHWMPPSWNLVCTKDEVLEKEGIRRCLHDLTLSSSVFFGHPSNLAAAFLTNPAPGANGGTLIRRGKRIRTARSLAQFPDLTVIKTILMRQLGMDWRNARPIVENYINSLSTRPFVAYFDEGPTENLAIVHLAEDLGDQLCEPRLEAFAISPHGWLNYIADQIWGRIRRDHKHLVWTVPRADAHLEWWFTRAHGSSKSTSDVLFWYGDIRRLDVEISRINRPGYDVMMEVEAVEEKLTARG